MSSNSEVDIDAYGAFLSKFEDSPEKAFASLLKPVIEKFFEKMGEAEASLAFAEQVSKAFWILFSSGRLSEFAEGIDDQENVELQDADVAEYIVEILESARLRDSRLHLSFLCKALIHAFSGSNDESVPPAVAEALPRDEIGLAKKFLDLHRKLAD